MDLDLKTLLSVKDFSRKDKILLVLAAGDNEEKSVGVIRDLAVQNGLREIQKWNISQVLSSLGNAVAKLPAGWSLTPDGRAILERLGVTGAEPTKAFKPTLRKYASAVSDESTRQFIDESITALEYGLLRAAVVLSWIGAVSILYEEVLRNHKAAFNAEASKRFSNWKTANTSDDLSRMKEYDFLQVLSAISMIGKNTKDELEQCLKLRNACGHPNSFTVGQHRVASHLETLVLNIYRKYVI